jgi:hypothetical protein
VSNDGARDTPVGTPGAPLSGDVNQLSLHAENLLVDSNAEVRLTGQQLRGTADAVGTAARKFRDPRATFFGPGEASLGPGESR